MEKMIVTEYGRPIMLNKVKEFVQRTMYLAEDKVIPYAVFALLDSGEMVNIGNFDDADTAEIAQIILDIFTEDNISTITFCWTIIRKRNLTLQPLSENGKNVI